MEEQGNEDGPRRRRRGRYPKEFRRDAAALVIDQRRTVADVARQLGVVEQTLGNWVRQERIDRGEREGLSSEERARIAELEKQVKRLTTERDLLKRSVAFSCSYVKRRGEVVFREPLHG
jgi:transposase